MSELRARGSTGEAVEAVDVGGDCRARGPMIVVRFTKVTLPGTGGGSVSVIKLFSLDSVIASRRTDQLWSSGLE